MMFSLIASVVLASSTPAAGPVHTPVVDAETADQGIVRVYDLTAAIPSYYDGGTERLLPQLVIAQGPGGFWFPRQEEEEEASPAGDVIDFLVSTLGQEAELEGRSVEYWSDSSVIVKGPEEVHARFRAVLAAAEAMFSSESRIRVDVLQLGQGQALELPVDGVVTTADWDNLSKALVAGGARQESTTLGLEEGRTARSGNSKFYEFVAGYDVEIAQSSFMYDPLIGTGRLGTRISAQGSPRRGGLGLALSLQCTHLVGTPEAREITTAGLLGSEKDGAKHLRSTANVVVPNLSTRVYAADVFLPDGHVLLFGGTTDLRSGQGAELVAVRRLDAAPPRAGWIVVPGTDRRYLVLASGAVSPPALELLSDNLLSESASGTLISNLPAWRNASDTLDASVGFPRDWSGTAELVGLGANTENLDLWSIGPWVVVGGGGAAAAGLPGPEAFELGTSEPLTVDLSLSDGQGGVPVTARISLRVGGEALAALGYERTAISNHYVEVAQFAAVSDPSETLLFDGMVVHLTASRGANGAIHLGADVRASLESGEPSAMRLEGFERLDVDTYEHQQFFADGRFVLEPGQQAGRFTLGGEPGDGTPALTIQVR